jgi:hypothetical protein
MRHLTKVATIFLFGSAAFFVLMNDVGKSPMLASAAARASATPPAGNSNSNAAAAAANAAAVPSGDKKIPKAFTLGKDSQDEHGEVAFDHDSHAFKMYMPDGKSAIACVECHHTDQPKSALKPPLSTSGRDVVLTLASWQASSQPVKECRSCHFQTGSVPEGVTLPTATYDERGKKVTKDLTNELAFHINCNTCHDAAAKLRPEIKGHPGFSTSTDCMTCHLKN